MKRSFFYLFIICSVNVAANGPYETAATTPNTNAIHQDSSSIVAWASTCNLERGWQDINEQSLGKTTVGTSISATGYPTDNGSVSLGDSGVAILQFNGKLFDGNGPDFAIYENGFNATFLELAKVYVSSDGINFVGFPDHSLTNDQQQIGTFDSLDCTNIHNLAGKYEAKYGTPFDLADIPPTSTLDINNISHVKIVDVVGTIGLKASLDSYGNRINDPYPTPFPSGGFDLSGVGAIHLNQSMTINEPINPIFTTHYSNQQFTINSNEIGAIIEIYTISGKLLLTKTIQELKTIVSLSNHDGILLFRCVNTQGNSSVQKVFCHK